MCFQIIISQNNENYISVLLALNFGLLLIPALCSPTQSCADSYSVWPYDLLLSLEISSHIQSNVLSFEILILSIHACLTYCVHSVLSPDSLI